ncbi:hypothetical protein [Schleiferia thermophila]|uniref:hypothetical protein n=1 Tax=Schleiferia thermophila TaxID=884107 RepID=UPI001362DAFB|nr:hypothetical protein [Schleiferia thermophila]
MFKRRVIGGYVDGGWLYVFNVVITSIRFMGLPTINTMMNEIVMGVSTSSD